VGSVTASKWGNAITGGEEVGNKKQVGWDGSDNGDRHGNGSQRIAGMYTVVR